VCVAFGYISPAKCPEVFEHGKVVLGDAYPAWEEAWKRNPFGIYRVDVGALLRGGTEVNFALFAAATQPLTTFVQ
jgi:hypothetical protein